MRCWRTIKLITPDIIEKILYDTDFKFVEIKKKRKKLEATSNRIVKLINGKFIKKLIK